MSKRGRPPHPDILTPREWEVLGLIREELSNEEIARRLGISIDGVKFHVSEILGKLGVRNRREAASWQAEEARPWWLAAGAPLFFWRRLSFGWLSPVLAGGLAAVVVGGVGLLVWALLATRGDETTTTVPPPLALPAGDRLAYVSTDGDLWLLDSTGQTQRLTEDGRASSPQWSPDGRWLLFVKDEAKPATRTADWSPRYSLWLADAESGEVRRLNAGPIRLIERPWSPSGRQIAYMMPSLDGHSASVWIADVDGNAQQLVPDDFGLGGMAWSPDGRRLALARVRPVVYPESVPLEERGPETVQIPRDNGVYLVDAHGGDPQPLVLLEEVQQAWDEGERRERPDATPLSSLGVVGVSGLQWSPNGRYVAFQASGLSASMAADGLPLFTVSVEGGRPVYHGIMLRSPALLDWFPESSRFVFTLGGGRDVYWNKRLAVAEAGVPGAQVIAEAAEPAPRPTWLPTQAPDWPVRSDAWPVVSPDGGRIAFQASEALRDAMPTLDVGKIEGPREGIWVVDAGGASPRQLTSDPDYLDFYPRWSADGELIMFLRTDGKGFSEDLTPRPNAQAEIWLVRSDGGEAKPLVTELLRIGSYYGLFTWEGYVAWYRAP